jgi:hypothetical protein
LILIKKKKIEKIMKIIIIIMKITIIIGDKPKELKNYVKKLILIMRIKMKITFLFLNQQLYFQIL